METLTAPPEPGLAVAPSSTGARLAWTESAWRVGRRVTARPEAVVTLFTALHLGVSFLNQVVLAYLFGVSGEMDAFLVAGALPLTLTSLVVGELGFVLIPLLAHRRESPQELAETASRLFSLLAVGGLGIGFLGVVGHGWILRLTTHAGMPPQTLALAMRLAPWIWLLVGLNFLGSFFTGLYHFYRRFTLPAVGLSFPYLGMIVGGLGWAPAVGIRSVVYGWLAGTLLKTAVLAAGIWKESGLRFRWNLRHPTARDLGFSLVPMGVALLPFSLQPVVDAYWASGLPGGSLSALGYASRIVIALALVAVQGISVVLFPAITDDHAAGKREEFRAKLNAALQTILLLILPVATLTAALGKPLLALLFERGSFDRADTLAVARVLPWYLAGMVGMALMNIISRGFFALRDYKTPAKLGLLALGGYAALCGLLVPHFSYVGIGMAYAVTWVLTFIVQAHLLGRAVGSLWDEGMLVDLGKMVVCSLSAAVAAVAIMSWLNPRLGALPELVFSGLAGLAVFAVLGAFVFRIGALQPLGAMVGKR